MLGIAVAVMAGMSSIKWKNTYVHLGQVTKGDVKSLAFEFKNNSNNTVQILEAKGSCGCTNVKYPEGSIAPGESASITADFRSSKVGAFKKNIRIRTSDSDEYTYLYFAGEVVE